MNLHFEPIWPWSSLSEIVGTAGVPVLATLILIAILFLIGPLLWPASPSLQVRFLSRIGFVLLACLVAIIFFTRRGAMADVRSLGAGILMLLPLALVGFTLGTYRGIPGATPTRVLIIASLRIASFLLAFFLLVRPSLAFSDESVTGARLWIVADRSESMTTADAVDNKTRWAYMLQLLEEHKPALDELKARGLEPEFFSFASDVTEFDPDKPGIADGSQTDFGSMLFTLRQKRATGRPVRAMIVFSDGADNGTLRPALKEAEIRTTPSCALHAVGLGNPATVDSRADVIVTDVAPESTVVGAKSTFRVNVTVDAPGFKDRPARLRVFIDKDEVRGEDIVLAQERGNVIGISVDAPTRPGEVELRVRVEDPKRPGQALPGELTDRNNEDSTFLTVRKDGVSVLLVDRQRAYEPQAIIDALRVDRQRITVHSVWLRGQKPLDPDAPRLFDFVGKQYDVIILGDVTADQVRSIDPQAISAIEKQVSNGAGLLLLGGYASFGPTWKNPTFEALSPVELGGTNQIERLTRIVPTDDGLRLFGYVMQLADGIEPSREAWSKLRELQGINQLALPADRTLINVLARSSTGDPILVAKNYDKGRVLAFAGDTTHRWVRTPETKALFGRFWRQLIFWLGKQDEASGSVWILPEKRNLTLKSDLDFSVGVRNKQGVEIEGGKFEVTLKAPDGKVTPLPTKALAGGRDGGKISAREMPEALAKPGVYELLVTGSATAPDGEKVTGQASARFKVKDDEIEKSRRSADHEYLKKLAAVGGGKFHLPSDLAKLLADLARDAEGRRRTQVTQWPSWDSQSPQPMRVLVLLLFVAFLTGEWALRRMWGLA